MLAAVHEAYPQACTRQKNMLPLIEKCRPWQGASLGASGLKPAAEGVVHRTCRSAGGQDHDDDAAVLRVVVVCSIVAKPQKEEQTKLECSPLVTAACRSLPWKFHLDLRVLTNKTPTCGHPAPPCSERFAAGLPRSLLRGCACQSGGFGSPPGNMCSARAGGPAPRGSRPRSPARKRPKLPVPT